MHTQRRGARFTKDIDAIDNALPQTMQMMSWTVFKVSGTLILISILQPLFILPCIPILALYVYVQQYYRHTSRELKRLDSVSRSPIYAHFSETLNGLATRGVMVPVWAFAGGWLVAVEEAAMVAFRFLWMLPFPHLAGFIFFLSVPGSPLTTS